MAYLIKRKYVNKQLVALRFFKYIFAITTMCFSALTFADQPLETISNFDYLIENEEIINDHDLSAIRGKGREEIKLYENETLAVILWDERGNDNHRNVNDDVRGHNNIQNVNLIINQR
jgi:hypothetical protein